MAETHSAPGAQRLVALVLLLAAGVLSLPVAAAALDSERAENYILPAQLLGMAVVGAVVGSLLPGLAGATASPRRALWTGVAVGVATAVLGVVLFFLLLNGFDGA